MSILEQLEEFQTLSEKESDLIGRFTQSHAMTTKQTIADCYYGDNKFGIGQISFETAPYFDPQVSETFWKASGFLYGRPEVKAISTETSDARHGTDYELPIWITAQLRGLSSQWNDWKVRAWKGLPRLYRDGQIRSAIDWWDAFHEIADGIESKGPKKLLLQKRRERLYARLVGIHAERDRRLIWIKASLNEDNE